MNSRDGSMHLDKAPDAFRTISEVADDLDVPQHVLRFWETRFSQIRPMKRSGGRRYYRPDDVELLRGIRHLLYGEGYTIRGVQRILREQGIKVVQGVGQGGLMPPALTTIRDDDMDLAESEGVNEISAVDADAGAIEAPDYRTRHDIGQPQPNARPVANSHLGDTLASRAGLRRDDVRKLEATLHELIECRRLIDAAAGDS